MKWLIVGTSVLVLALGSGCAGSVDPDTSTEEDGTFGVEFPNDLSIPSGSYADGQRPPMAMQHQPGGAYPAGKPGPVPWRGDSPLPTDIQPTPGTSPCKGAPCMSAPRE